MSDETAENYVEDAAIHVTDLAIDPPGAMQFGTEHVQWALNAEMPGHISGIDYTRRPGNGQHDEGQYVV